MSEAVTLWILGSMLAVLMGLAGALFFHVRECREIRAALASLTVQLSHLAKEIGDHDSGIRGQLHRLRGEVSPYILMEQKRRGE